MYLFLLLALIPACVLANDVCPPDNVLEYCACDRGTVYHKSDLECTYIDTKDKIVDEVNKAKDYGWKNILISVSRFDCFPDVYNTKRPLESIRLYDSGFDQLFCERPVTSDLKELEVVSCRVKQPIPTDTFGGMTNLDNFTASDIKLTSEHLENMPESIKKIKLLDCGIDELSDRVVREKKNLQELRIEGGNIRRVQRTMLPQDSQIEYISFASNKLTEVPSEFWNDSPKLKVANLTENLISTMPRDTFRPLLNKGDFETLDMTSNPIKCDCDVKWLGDLEDSHRRKLEGTCEDPKELHGKQLREMRPDNFQGC